MYETTAIAIALFLLALAGSMGDGAQVLPVVSHSTPQAFTTF